MARFKMFIEYEGTRYSGWQVQKNARTIQGELLNAAKIIFQSNDIEIYGSGRTDAGVHALLQIAHLDVQTMLAPEILRLKFNDALPADIVVLEIEKAPSSFHARHDAKRRSYLYQISRRRTAFAKRFVWWIKDPLDLSKMNSAASLFVGMKDLRSFTADDPEEKSTRVAIDEITISEQDDLILIRIVGSHFLWKLVRQIVGILVEAGRGTMPLQKIEEFLRISAPDPAKFTAPPSGLFLESVMYDAGDSPGDLRPAFDRMFRSYLRSPKRALPRKSR